MKKILIILLLISRAALSMDNPFIQPTQEEYELFKVVQAIRKIAHESREEIRRTMGFADDREISKDEPNEHIAQISKGLILEMDSFPETMQSPWGRIPILEQGCHPSDFCASLAASQLFFKRVSASIVGFAGFSKKYNLVAESITRASNFETAIKPISKEQLETYIGTAALLTPHKCGHHVLYRINQVDSFKIPESQIHDYTKRARNPEEVELVWKLMEARYKKENQ